jgi:hypothetical protein
MAINDYPVNAAQMNAAVEKTSGSGAIVSFYQVVDYHYIGSGAIASFDQNVTCTASGAIINIGQDVQ